MAGGRSLYMVKRNFKALTIFLAIFIGILCVIAIRSHDQQKVGVLDSYIELSFDKGVESKLIQTDNKWEFYWERFLNYSDLNNQTLRPDNRVDISIPWTNYKINGQKISEFGYATYKLNVKVSKEANILSMSIPPISTSYRLYINDKLMMSNGIAGESNAISKPEVRPVIITFIPPAEEFNIIIHQSNFEDINGAVRGLLIGTPEAINKVWDNIQTEDVFLIGSFLIMALYYILIFFLRGKDRASIYFSLLCIIMLIRVSIIDSYFIYNIFSSLPYRVIMLLNYLSIYWAPTIFAIFVFELYPFKLAKQVKMSLLCTSVAQTIFSIVVPVHTVEWIAQIPNCIAVLAILFCLINTLVAVIKGKQCASILFFSCIVVIITLVHDILFKNAYINGKSDLIPYGMFILILGQAVTSTIKFANDYFQLKTITVKLEDMLNTEKEMTEKLTNMDALKDEFLANTTHELRTPLNGIISVVEHVLSDDLEELSKKQKDNLEIILSSARRLSTLINDILDYSKLKHGDVRLLMKSSDLYSCVRVVLEVYEYMLFNKNIRLVNNISKDFKAVYADENRLYHIIFNLIGNAVKFTEAGEISLSSEINDKMAEITIKSTGIGIPQNKLNDIFRSFEQLGASINEQYGGTGLGLSITKKVVELHGGQLWVKAYEGKGAEFIFSIPLANTEAQMSEMDISKVINISPSLVNNLKETQANWIRNGELTIMIVDDEKVNLQTLINMLSAKDYSIIAVGSGSEALAILESGTIPDVCILDIMMPRMSGYEVCKKIREKFSIFELPVIFLTAKYGEADMVKGFEVGCNDFLHKPFATTELLTRVKTLIDLKKSFEKTKWSELAFLHHIKPHFLFNSLNSIATLCNNDPEEAKNRIYSLSQYLRDSFDIDKVDNYVSIEKQKID